MLELAKWYLLIGVCMSIYVFLGFLLVRHRIENPVSFSDCVTTAGVSVFLWPVCFISIVMEWGSMAHLVTERPFPFSSSSLEEAIDRNQEEKNEDKNQEDKKEDEDLDEDLFNPIAFGSRGSQNAALEKEREEFIDDPVLSSFLRERAAFIRGAVRKPGAYPVGEGTSLDSIVSAAGGLSLEANVNNIEITSKGLHGVTRKKIDTAIERPADVMVGPGDAVRVMQRFQKIKDNSVQIMGEVNQGQALLRSNARPNEDIWISGCLGDAALVLAHQQQRIKLQPVEVEQCLPALLTPTPRIKLGQQLINYANSAIDISDGLLADLGHILDCSDVGAIINIDAIPCSGILQNYLPHPDVINCLLAGGDDYELCFTASTINRLEIERLSSELSLPLTRIGKTTAIKGLKVLDSDGSELTQENKGYEHFYT